MGSGAGKCPEEPGKSCFSECGAPEFVEPRGVYLYLPMAQLSHDQFWGVLFKMAI